MSARAYSADVYLMLRSRTKLLIERLGGVEAAADFTRVGKSMLSNYQTRNGTDFIPVDVMMDLERAAEEPIVSRELVRLLDAAPAADCNPMAAAAAATVSAANLLETARRAYEDGRLEAHELDDMIKAAERNCVQANQTHDGLCRLRQQMRDHRAAPAA